jgi:hypothetical protein
VVTASSPTGDTAAAPPAVWWSASRGWLLSERPRKDGYHVAEVRPGGDAVDEIEPALPDDAIPLCPPDSELARLRQELDHADHFGRGEFRVTSWAYEQVCHADREKAKKIAALLQEVAELRAAAVSSSSPDDTAPGEDLHSVIAHLARKYLGPSVGDVLQALAKSDRPGADSDTEEAGR